MILLKPVSKLRDTLFQFKHAQQKSKKPVLIEFLLVFDAIY